MPSWKEWACACLLIVAAPAPADPIINGSQVIFTFDHLAVGTGDIEYDAFGDPLFRNTIFGGTVTAVPPAEAASGTHVYRGASIGFSLADPFNYSWPAVGALVTGPADITLTLRAYDYDLATEVIVFTGTAAGGSTNFHLGAGSEWHPGAYTSALFQSTEAFDLDDLTLGLVRVAPGIPEPADWLMIIAGLAIAGLALRLARLSAAADQSNIVWSPQ